MILITGATGNIGTELVKRLVSKRTPIRIITRDQKKIAHLGPEVGRVIGDRHEPSVVQRALQEVEKVFVLSGPFDIDHEADRLLMNKAKDACVRQIVLISSSTVHLAEKNSIGVFHREKEIARDPRNSDSRFSRSLDPDPQRRIYLLRKRSRKADRAAGANL